MTFSKKKILLIIPAIILLGGAGAGGYYAYTKYTSTSSELARLKQSANQNQQQEETKKIIAEVGNLMELPSETPTVASITDKEKLKDQAFFNKAENGDKVIIYTQSKKVILYRPSSKKIIDIAPINLSSATPSGQVAGAKTSSAPTPTQKPISISILNGTDTTGLTNKIDATVKKLLPTAKTDRANAQKTDYDKSLIVVLSDAAKEQAKSLSDTLKISIGELPKDETIVQKSDIVIIAGKDQI